MCRIVRTFAHRNKQFTTMKNDALSVANWFVRESLTNPQEHALTQLRLNKLVYLAHGWCLAAYHSSFLNENYDQVEAWQYGPVIPSVYHAFKHNGKNIVTEPVGFLKGESEAAEYVIPVIADPQIVRALQFVWKRYSAYSTSDIITALHRDDTPWKYAYKEDKHEIIPDWATELYYKEYLTEALQHGRNNS